MPPNKTRAAKSAKTSSSKRADMKSTVPAKRTASRKRKAVSEEPGQKNSPPPKAQKKEPGKKTARAATQTQISTKSVDRLEKPIVINRAPVLELWGACVAGFLHPDLSWNTCLSIGSSIATITAISKGRAIGTIAEPDPRKMKDKGQQDEELPTIKVMGFPMTMNDDAVIVKGKAKTARETSLVRKFGEENLGRVKDTMLTALKTWEGNEDELDKKAFHMYEQFRPEVAKGQQGWGRKGELHLPKIESVVGK